MTITNSMTAAAHPRPGGHRTGVTPISRAYAALHGGHGLLLCVGNDRMRVTEWRSFLEDV